MHVTRAHTHTRAHRVIVYLPSTLIFLNFLLHPNPFPAFSVLPFYSLCRIPSHFYASHFASCFLRHSTLDVQSAWEGHNTILDADRFPKSPLLPCRLSSLWEMHPCHQQAQQFMQEWCDFLLQRQLLWKQYVINQSAGLLYVRAILTSEIIVALRGQSWMETHPSKVFSLVFISSREMLLVCITAFGCIVSGMDFPSQTELEVNSFWNYPLLLLCVTLLF